PGAGGGGTVILSLRDVVAGYGGGDVLRGVDLRVEKGSITCIVGPNGAGKSTVLRTISGLLRCHKGEIFFEKTNIERLSSSSILEMGIAQVPQHHALFPSMTIRENVLMGAYLVRKDRALVRKRYAAVEEMVPWMKERAGERAGNLSGGQRRMVELGRSLMLDPKLVLLDEPSLGLDPRSLAQVSNLVAAANERGRTILLVEQNVKLGLSMATHGVVMEAGKVRLQGKPGDLLSNPEVAGLYLGGSVGDTKAGHGETRAAARRSRA
ncbi:MAG: ABC transporter ATP-binding protein, partial [Actinomycetota bacterium]